jgi:ABC-2 type transport system ATP-binding protein
VITVQNLVKNFQEVKAVNNISFTVKNGEILGFLGPNGAGKTTTLRIITSYLAPTSGNVYVDDLNVLEDSMEIRKRLGYLPELNPLYYEVNVYDFLKFVSAARGIDKNKFKKRFDEVAELCGLRGEIHKNIGELSKGFRQRVGLAQAIFHNPEILILDEPTSGLDPNQIVEIRQLIKNLGREKTVVISSHILQEVQATADRMIIINRGNIVADGTINDLMSSFRGRTRLELELKNASEESISGIQTIHSDISIIEVKKWDNTFIVKLDYPNAIDPRQDIFNYALDSKWIILEISREKTSLEDVFRQLTIEGGEANA